MSAYGADAMARRAAMARRRCETITELRIVDYFTALERHHPKVSPSRAGIAARVGRCERSVSRAVVALESRGVLAVWRDPAHRRTDGTFSRRRTSCYRFRWPPKRAQNAPNPLVAPRGHACPVYALSVAIEPGGPPAAPPGGPPGPPRLTEYAQWVEDQRR